MVTTVSWYKNRAYAQFEFSDGQTIERRYYQLQFAFDAATAVAELDDDSALTWLITHP